MESQSWVFPMGVEVWAAVHLEINLTWSGMASRGETYYNKTVMGAVME